MPQLRGPLQPPPPERPYGPTGPSAAQVFTGWRGSGANWLTDLSRAHLRHVLRQLGETSGPGAPRLYENAALCRDVLTLAREKLGPRRSASALKDSIFQCWPVPKELSGPLNALVQAGWPQTPPRWYRADYKEVPGIIWSALEAAQRPLRALLPSEEIDRCLSLLEIPTGIWRGGWVDPIVEAGVLQLLKGQGTVPIVSLLMRLADHGQELNKRAPMRPPQRRVVQGAVAWALEKGSSERAAIAALVCARVGSPFEESERWFGLESEMGTIRPWLLDGFFLNVWGPISGARPDKEGVENFWNLQARRIDKMWLLLSPESLARLQTGPEGAILASLSSVIKVQELRGLGSKEGGVLWLTLKEGRCAATVLEWGEVGSFRLRAGAHLPGTKLSAQGLRWMPWEETIEQAPGWVDKLNESLAWFGMRDVQ